MGFSVSRSCFFIWLLLLFYTLWLLSLKLKNVRNCKAAKLRESGLVPAELYGRRSESASFFACYGFQEGINKPAKNTIVNIVVDGQKLPSIISDVALDYLTSEPIHVDLHKVRLDENFRPKFLWSSSVNRWL